jgi:polyisoprenoid-binding protein YceI
MIQRYRDACDMTRLAPCRSAAVRPGESQIWKTARGSAIAFMPCLALALANSPSTLAATSLQVKASGEKTFYADNRAGNGQVSIFSESTLEDFTVVCNRIAGQCQLDPRNLEGIHGEFWFRVQDMKTGIELRDHHMASPDWLDAARYPKVIVKIDKAQDVERTEDGSAKLKLVGSCSVHGQTHDITIPATVTYLDETPQTMKRVKGDLLRVRASFSIKLSDYGVTGPKGSETIGLKVADKLEIKVAVFCSTQKPPVELEADVDVSSSRPATVTSAPAGAVERRPPPPRPPK